MISTSELFDIFEQRRLQLDMSRAEVCKRALGQPDGSALQNMKRGSSPTFENLQKLCHVLDLSLVVGPPGGEPRLDASGISPDARFAFSETWLGEIGLRPGAVEQITADDEGMAPTIPAGSLVLIDHSVRGIPHKLRDPGDASLSRIYAFSSGDGVMLRRAERPAVSLLILTADNPAIGPRIISRPEAVGLRLLGEVVAWLTKSHSAASFPPALDFDQN